MKRFSLEEFIQQVEAMPEDQQLAAVDAKRAECDRALSSIRTQLEQAKVHRLTTGEYSDAQWYHSAEAARRTIGWKVQRLNEYRGRLRKRVNQACSEKGRSGFLEQFYLASKEVLAPEVMAAVLRKASEARPCQA